MLSFNVGLCYFVNKKNECEFEFTSNLTMLIENTKF